MINKMKLAIATLIVALAALTPAYVRAATETGIEVTGTDAYIYTTDDNGTTKTTTESLVDGKLTIDQNVDYITLGSGCILDLNGHDLTISTQHASRFNPTATSVITNSDENATATFKVELTSSSTSFGDIFQRVVFGGNLKLVVTGSAGNNNGFQGANNTHTGGTVFDAYNTNGVARFTGSANFGPGDLTLKGGSRIYNTANVGTVPWPNLYIEGDSSVTNRVVSDQVISITGAVHAASGSILKAENNKNNAQNWNGSMSDMKGTMILEASQGFIAFYDSGTLEYGTIELVTGNVRFPSGSHNGEITIGTLRSPEGTSTTSGRIVNTTDWNTLNLKVGALGTDSVFYGNIGNDFSSTKGRKDIKLEKVGTGILTLGGENEYMSDTTISAGAIRLVGSGRLGYTNNTSSVIFNGGELIFGKGVVTDPSARLKTNSGKTAKIGVDEGETAAIAGTPNTCADFEKTRAGTLVVTNGLAHTGTTKISAGAIRVKPGVTLGTGSLTISSGARVEVDVNDVFSTWTPNATVELFKVGSSTASSQFTSANVTLYGSAITNGMCVYNFTIDDEGQVRATYSPGALEWGGANGDNWDTTTEDKWYVGDIAYVYNDGQDVAFTDRFIDPATTNIVNVAEDVAPKTITVDMAGSGSAYNLTGSGKITTDEFNIKTNSEIIISTELVAADFLNNGLMTYSTTNTLALPSDASGTGTIVIEKKGTALSSVGGYIKKLVLSSSAVLETVGLKAEEVVFPASFRVRIPESQSGVRSYYPVLFVGETNDIPASVAVNVLDAPLYKGTVTSKGILIYKPGTYDFNEVDGVEESTQYDRTNITNNLEVVDKVRYYTNHRLDVPKDASGSSGSLTLRNGTILDANDELQIAIADNSTGTVSVVDGAILNVGKYAAIAHGSNSYGELLIDGGKVNVAGDFYLNRHSGTGADKTNSTAVVYVANGILDIKKELRCGGNSGSDGKATINVGDGGKVVVSGSTYVGYGSGAKEQLDILGGSVQFSDLYLNNGTDADAVLSIYNGAQVVATNKIYFGKLGRNSNVVESNGSATINISGEGTVLDSGNEIEFGALWSKFKSETINLDGGTLKVQKFKRITAATNGTTINFNGGTLQAKADLTFLAAEGMNYAIGEGGMIIDTASHSVTIEGNYISKADGVTEAVLTKKGEGTLTISDSMTAITKVVLCEGSIKLPSTFTNVENGSGYLTLTSSTSGNVTTWTLVWSNDSIVAWTGEAGDNSWSNTNNWRYLVKNSNSAPHPESDFSGYGVPVGIANYGSSITEDIDIYLDKSYDIGANSFLNMYTNGYVRIYSDSTNNIISTTADNKNFYSGTRFILDNAGLSFGSINIGREGDSVAEFIVKDGYVNASNYTCIGTTGPAYFEMSGGTYNQNGGVFIVGQGVAAGTAVITGGVVNLNSSAKNGNYDNQYSSLYIGEGSGGGTLTIGGDAVVNVTAKTLIGMYGDGVLNVDGGVFNANNEIRVGVRSESANGGTINITGGKFNANGTTLGRGNTGRITMTGGEYYDAGTLFVGWNSPGYLDVSGGTVDVSTATIGANATALGSTMTVAGDARVNLRNDSFVGTSGCAGTLTITNNGFVTCGTKSVPKWVKVNNGGTINLQDGGRLEVCRLTSEGGMNVNFDGGELVSYGGSGFLIGNIIGGTSYDSGTITLKVLAGGAIIETSGVDTSINSPLLSGATNDGGLTKRGTGALTLASGNTFNGPVRVEGGTLNLPSDFNTTSAHKLILAGGNVPALTDWQSVEIVGGTYEYSTISNLTSGTITLTGGTIKMTVAEAALAKTISLTGGIITIDGTTLENPNEGDTIEVNGISVSGVEAANVIYVAGTAFNWTPTTSEGNVTLMTAGAVTGNNIWIGGERGNWNDAANWKYGKPTESQVVEFNNDAFVGIEGYNGNAAQEKCAGIVANGEVTIWYKSGLDDWYPQIWLYGDVLGTGKLIVRRSGLINKNDENLNVNCNIDFDGKSGDSYFSGGTFVFKKDVAITSKLVAYSSFIASANVVLSDGANIDARDWVTFAGAGNTLSVVEGGSADVTLKGDSRIEHSISGNVNLTCTYTSTLAGDNSAFTGSFTTTASDTRIQSADSGSTNASWTLKGNTFLDFPSGGEIEFGALDFSNSGNNGAFAMTNYGEVVSATIKVGAKGDSTITETSSSYSNLFGSPNSSDNGWTASNIHGTLVKVGEDTKLTISGSPSNIYMFDVSEGMLEFSSGATVSVTNIRFAEGTAVNMIYDGVPAAGRYKLADVGGTFTDEGAIAKVNGNASSIYFIAYEEGSLYLVVAKSKAVVQTDDKTITYATAQEAFDNAPSNSTIRATLDGEVIFDDDKYFSSVVLEYEGSYPVEVGPGKIISSNVSISNVIVSLGTTTLSADSRINGILNIPEGSIVTITNSAVLASASGITGEGRLIEQGFVVEGTLRNSYKNVETWKGTLELKDQSINSIDAANFGNTNSTVCFNGVSGYLRAPTGGNTTIEDGDVKTIEIGTSGLTFNNKYTSGSGFVYTIAADLIGSGPIHFGMQHQQSSKSRYEFTGDVSQFTGAIDYGTLGSYRAIVVFRNADEVTPDPTDWGQIIVTEGKTVNVASRWVGAGGAILNGIVNIASTGSITNDTGGAKTSGSGTINYAKLPVVGTIPAFNSAWTGTVVLPETVLSTKTALPLIGLSSDKGTIVIKGITRSTTSNSLHLNTGTATVKGTIQLDGDLHITDGNSNATYTWNKIKGDGKILFTMDGGSASGITHAITMLDDYFGAIEYGTASITIGTVNKTEWNEGDIMVSLAANANLTTNPADITVTTNNVATGFKLFKATDGNLYVAVAYVVDGTTTNYYESVASAATAAEAANITTITALVDGLNTVEGWDYSEGTFTKNSNIARNTTTETEYSSVATALAEAQEGETIVLFRNSTATETVTINTNITLEVEQGVTFSGTVEGEGTLAMNSSVASAPLADGWTGTFVINWEVSGAFDVDAYAKGASTVKLAKDSRVHFSRSNNPPTVAATLLLDADLTINNGWSRTSTNSAVTTLAKLSSTTNGSLTLAAIPGDTSQGAKFNFAFTKIEDFEGALNVGQYYRVTIGEVVLDEEPSIGEKVVDMTVASGATLTEPIATSFDGVTLVYKGDGLYRYVEGAYYWTGGGTDNNWTTPENWGLTEGYPTNGCTAVFDVANATVAVSSTVTVGSIIASENVQIDMTANLNVADELTVVSGKRLCFNDAGETKTYPVVQVGDYVGVAVDTEDETVGSILALSDVILIPENDGSNLNIAGYVEVVEGTKSGIYGNGGSSATGTYVDVKGNLIGKGALYFRNYSNKHRAGVTLSGNNEEFEGEAHILMGADPDMRGSIGYATSFKFNGDNTGSSKATWYLSPSDTSGNNNFGSTTQVTKFGALIGEGTYKMLANCANKIILGNETDSTCGLSFQRTGGGVGMNIDKVGTGTITYTGNINDSGGYLSLQEGMMILDATNRQVKALSFDGGTLGIGENTGYDYSAVITDNAEAVASISVISAATDYTMGTQLTATKVAGLVKKGAGTLTLAKAPTYTGETVVEEGTLVVPIGTAFSGAVNVKSGAALAFAGNLAWENVTTNLCTFATVPDVSTLGRIKFTGLNSHQKVTFSVSDNDNTLVATITKQPLVWNGEDGYDWSAENVWLVNDEPTTFEDGDIVQFTDDSIGDELDEKTVLISGEVAPAKIVTSLSKYRAVIFDGEGSITTENLVVEQSGEGVIKLADDVMHGIDFSISGTLEVEAGVEGVVNLANVTPVGEGVKIRTISGTAIASGSINDITVENNSAIILKSTLAVNSSALITGAGSLTLGENGYLYQDSPGMSNFEGDIYLEASSRLRIHKSSNFGSGVIHFNGGTLDTSSGNSGAGSQQTVSNDIYVIGEGNVIQNNMTINNSSYINLTGSFHGSGRIKAIDSTSTNGTKGIYLAGDNSDFDGIFDFDNHRGGYNPIPNDKFHCNPGFSSASAGSAKASWNVIDTGSANGNWLGFEIGNNNTIELGQFNVVDSTSATLYVKSTGNTIEIGGKPNTTSTVNGQFQGQSITLTKVGETSTLKLGPEFSMPSGSTININEGTFAPATNLVFDGVDLNFSETARLMVTLPLDEHDAPIEDDLVVFETTGNIEGLNNTTNIVFSNEGYEPTGAWVFYVENGTVTAQFREPIKYHWTGKGTGEESDFFASTNNWVTGTNEPYRVATVPPSGMNAINFIDQARSGDLVVDLGSNAWYVADVDAINTGKDRSLTFKADEGGSLTAKLNTWPGLEFGRDGYSTVIFDSGTYSFTDGSQNGLFVGWWWDASPCTGIVEIVDAVVSTKYLELGRDHGRGFLNMTGNGSLNIYGDALVGGGASRAEDGFPAEGYLNIQNGTLNVTGATMIGKNVNNTESTGTIGDPIYGKMTVGGGVVNGNNFFVGEWGGVGDLEITNGEFNASGLLNIGTTGTYWDTTPVHGTGTVWQTGGKVSISDVINVGKDNKAYGEYIMDGGSLLVKNQLHVGDGNGAYGVVRINDGGVILGSGFHVGNVDGSTGIVYQTGGYVHVTNNYMSIANIGANAYGRYYMSGGKLELTGANNVLVVGRHGDGYMEVSDEAYVYAGGMQIGESWDTNISSDGHLKVAGGEVEIENDVNVGFNSQGKGTLEIADGKMTVGGTVYVGRNSGSVGALTISGGEMSASHVEIAVPGSSSPESRFTMTGGVFQTGYFMSSNSANAILTFDGGVLQATQDRDNFFENITDITIDTENGVGLMFDTGANNITFANTTKFTGGGMFTKLGSGSLTFNDPGMPKSMNISLCLAGNGTLSAPNWIFNSVHVTNGTYQLSEVPMANEYCVEGRGSLRLDVADAVNTSGTNIVVNGGTLYIDASAETYEIGDVLTFSKILTNGVEGVIPDIKIVNTDLDWAISVDGEGTVKATAQYSDGINYWVGGEIGLWHDAYNWKRGIPTTNDVVTCVTNDAVICFTNNSSDTELDANLLAGTFAISNNAVVTLTSGVMSGVECVTNGYYCYNRLLPKNGVTGEGVLELGRCGLANLAGCNEEFTVSEDVTLRLINEGSSSGGESWIEGANGKITVYGTIEAASGYSKILQDVEISNGVVRIQEGATLYNGTSLTMSGEMEGAGTFINGAELYCSAVMTDFAGTITLNNSGGNYSNFYSPCAGASNAFWNITGDVRFSDAGGNNQPAEFHIGQIFNNTTIRKMVVPSAMRLYIGARGGDSNITGSYFTAETNGTPVKVENFILHKVGTGKLVYGSYGCPEIIVESGELALAALDSYDNTKAYCVIDSIIVKDGGKLSGEVGDGLTITNLTIEAGGVYCPALTNSGCTSITATNVTFEDGALVEFRDSTGYAKNVTAKNANRFLILTASGTITGVPSYSPSTLQPKNGGGYYWRPAVRGRTMVIETGTDNPGFILRFR